MIWELWEGSGFAGEGKGCSEILEEASQAGRQKTFWGSFGRERELLAEGAAASRDWHFAASPPTYPSPFSPFHSPFHLTSICLLLKSAISSKTTTAVNSVSSKDVDSF